MHGNFFLGTILRSSEKNKVTYHSNTNNETAELMETIVKQHITELLRRAAANAQVRTDRFDAGGGGASQLSWLRDCQRRGARMGLEDVIFQIRRDKPKLNRLKGLLSVPPPS
jgi:hypothetical protein